MTTSNAAPARDARGTWPWERPEYRRIVSAHAEGETLYVLFADGACASIGTARLARPKYKDLRWGEVRATEHDITVPTADESEPLEVSWLTVRALSDPAFDAYLVRRGEEEGRRVGERLRALRKDRKLAGAEVARRAGLTPQALWRLETGAHDVGFSTLRKVLAAMGCTLADLSDEDEED